MIKPEEYLTIIGHFEEASRILRAYPVARMALIEAAMVLLPAFTSVAEVAEDVLADDEVSADDKRTISALNDENAFLIKFLNEAIDAILAEGHRRRLPADTEEELLSLLHGGITANIEVLQDQWLDRMYRNLVRTLKSLREECGFSQADLAARLGVTRGAVNNYESGQRKISIDTIYMWAHACGHDPEIVFRKRPAPEAKAHSALEFITQKYMDLTSDGKGRVDRMVNTVGSVVDAFRKRNEQRD